MKPLSGICFCWVSDLTLGGLLGSKLIHEFGGSEGGEGWGLEILFPSLFFVLFPFLLYDSQSQ